MVINVAMWFASISETIVSLKLAFAWGIGTVWLKFLANTLDTVNIQEVSTWFSSSVGVIGL